MAMSPKSKAEAIKKQLVVFNELLKKPENKYCADCKKTTPTWASVNLGVFVCINCSGCHREIGVHITKIRSTNLDVWPKDILNNFKLINNQIANKYWECKLKNFDFKKIQNDKYKLVEFIRNKYEYKKWVDPNKKMDPMTLIMKGKIKKYKSLYCPSEGEEEEEEEENEKKINKTKKIKKDKNIKNAKSDDDEEEEDDNQDSSDKNENNNNKVINNIDNNNKINENNLQQHDSKNKNEDMLLDLNMNNNDMNNFNSQQNLLNLNNNTKNNDIMDLFNSGNNQNNMNKNINTYFSPQPMRPGGIDNIFQQMPNNTKLNLQKNNINFGFTNNNNMFNNGNNSNNLQNMNNMNNNNMFNINYGLNNNFNNMNNNLNNLNNFNFNNNLSNNNINNKDNKNLQNNNNLSGTIPNKKIEFNMEYFNKNMETKKSNTGSTYNFKKKKEDPFANLVSFKK
jgi:stromal membrane-associated protein